MLKKWSYINMAMAFAKGRLYNSGAKTITPLSPSSFKAGGEGKMNNLITLHLPLLFAKEKREGQKDIVTLCPNRMGACDLSGLVRRESYVYATEKRCGV